MKIFALGVCLAGLAAGTLAQAPPVKSDDTWSNIPPASDDRYTNPAKPLYAGPNGWFNFGEVRAEIANAAKTRYEFKGGFRLITHTFTAVSEKNNLHVLTLDFANDAPAPGVYEASVKGDAGAKKVQVSFGDVSGQKIRNWTSAARAGTVTVSVVNGFTYFKFRGVALQPTGIHNTGDLKNPMTVGFEGAVSPQ